MMIFRTRLISLAVMLLIAGTAIWSMPHPAMAAVGCDDLQGQFNNYGGNFSNAAEKLPHYCTATGLLQYIINIILSLVGGITILFIMIGGFRYITSSGNQETAGKAKQTVLWAVIGLAVVMMAAAMVNIIINLVVNGKAF